MKEIAKKGRWGLGGEGQETGAMEEAGKSQTTFEVEPLN